MGPIFKLRSQPYVPSPGYVGEPTRDPITSNLWRVGQINHRFEQRWLQSHGRYLAGMEGLGSMNGFGAMTNMEEPNDPKFASDGTTNLEQMDDVSGSGIFDAPGTRANLHREYGVFEDNASVPGYVQRENLFRVSKEVRGVNDADVVIVPAGGMTFREQNGVPINYDARDLPSPCWPEVFSNVACRGGPSPLQPFVAPMEATVASSAPLMPSQGIATPFPSQPQFPFSAGMGVRPGGRREGGRHPDMPLRLAQGSQREDGRGQAFTAAPTGQPSRRQGASTSQSLTARPASSPRREGTIPQILFKSLDQQQPRKAVLGVAQRDPETYVPTYQAGPTGAPKDRPVSFNRQSLSLLRMNTQDAGVQTKPIRNSRSLGADDSGPGVGTYIFYGALIGGAIAMLKGATMLKVK